MRLEAVVSANPGIPGGPFAVQTLNSFGNQLLRGVLRGERGALTLGSDPAADARFAVRRALERSRGKDQAVEALLPKLQTRLYADLISALKNGLVLPNEVFSRDARETRQRLAQLISTTRVFEPWLMAVKGRPDATEAGKRLITFLLRIYVDYCADMAANGRIDFDDQKLIPYRRFRDDPALVSSSLGPVQVIIVDEFQDINLLDFELIRFLAEGRQLIVVGDDDQAIYGFRGCSPDYILNLEARLGRPVATHILRRNYRCPRNVVEHSQRLIRHNRYRLEKESIATQDKDALVSLWHCANSAAEAQIIARAIKQMYGQREGLGFQLRDVAILIRLNSQSLPIQLALAREEIPFACRREDNVLLSDAMRNLTGLLRLSVKVSTDPSYVTMESCSTLCRCYFRFTKDAEIRELCDASTRAGGLREGVRRLRETKKRGKITEKFQDAVTSLFEQQPPGVLVRRLGEKFKYLGGLAATFEEALEEGGAPLGELIEIADRFGGTTDDLVVRLEDLRARVEGALGRQEDHDGVNILTYFRAKGRQWDSVFLPSVNQKVIPHAKAPLEEERRLFYVAVTRATANLFLSFTRSVVRSPVEPSQFLNEMGIGQAQEKRAGRA